MSEAIDKPEPEGIGGWMILPVLGMFGTIILTGLNLLSLFNPETREGLKNIFSSGTGMEALRLPVLLDYIGGIAIVIFAVITLYSMFTRHPLAIKIIITYFILLFLSSAADFWAVSRIDTIINTKMSFKAFEGLLRSAVAATIWIPYFLMSNRSQNTFGRRDTRIPDVFD